MEDKEYTLNLNNVAISTIKSKSLRTYLKDIKHQFTELEQISLIHNSGIALKTKQKLIKKYLESSDNNVKEVAEHLMANNEYIEKLLNGDKGNENIVIAINDELKKYDYKENLSNLKENIDKDDIKLTDVCIYNTKEHRFIAGIKLNNNLSVTGYTLFNEDEMTGIEDKYINIPNNLEVGDIVKISGDTEDKEYVVVLDSNLPDSLDKESLTYDDASVAIVPKDIFSKDRNYLLQISDIISNRIQLLNNSVDKNKCLEEKQDDILRNQVYVNVTLLEK